MDQVQVNIEHGRAVRLFDHHVLLPDFFKQRQGLLGSHRFLFTQPVFAFPPRDQATFYCNRIAGKFSSPGSRGQETEGAGRRSGIITGLLPVAAGPHPKPAAGSQKKKRREAAKVNHWKTLPNLPNESFRNLFPARKVLRSASYLAILWIGSLVCLPSAHAEEGTKISLGTVSGPPKTEVFVPFYLIPSPPGTQVGEVAATVRFEDKAVKYLRVEKGFLLDGVNGEVKAKLDKDPGDPGKSIVQLEVATKGEARKGLREGVVFTVIFQIAENAVAGTKVDLSFEKLTASDVSAPPQKIEPLVQENGTIEVITPEEVPYVACFFFTH